MTVAELDALLTGWNQAAIAEIGFMQKPQRTALCKCGHGENRHGESSVIRDYIRCNQCWCATWTNGNQPARFAGSAA